MPPTNKQIRSFEIKLILDNLIVDKKTTLYTIKTSNEFVTDLIEASDENPVWYEVIGKAFVAALKECKDAANKKQG